MPAIQKHNGKSDSHLQRAKQPSKWILIAGLITFTFILYGNSINHDYTYDDGIVTVNNLYVQKGFHGIGDVFKKGFLYGFNNKNDESYRPLPLASFALEVGIFGNNPHAHHFIHVCWYALTAVMLYFTLLIVFRKYHYVVPLFITLLYLAHPVHTEVVANLKSRDELFCFLFSILAIYCSLSYFIRNRSYIYMIISWVLYFLALISKEESLSFIVVIPLIYYFFSDLPFKKIIFISIPFFIAGCLYLFIRASVLDSITFSKKIIVINNSLMGADNLGDHTATAIYILGKYLWLLFFPVTLSWDYSYNQIPIVSFTSIDAIIPVIIYLGLGIYACMNIRKKDPVAFGIFYFLITMSLVSNVFINIASTMGERFLFTSSLGFCIAIVFVLLIVLKQDATKLKTFRASGLYGCMTVILALFTIRTIARNEIWKNSDTFSQSGVITAPNSARTHQALGSQSTVDAMYISDLPTRERYFKTAEVELNKALSILPDYTEARYDLGYNYFVMGKQEEAKSIFEKCIEMDPKYPRPYNDLGTIYYFRNQYPQAIETLKKAIEFDPNFAIAYENIGIAYYKMGQFEAAKENDEKALSLNPNLKMARWNLFSADSMLNKSHKI